MMIISERQQPAQISDWQHLPARTRALLQREGLDSPAAWAAAGARRKLIFGITRRVVEELDALALGHLVPTKSA